MHAALCRWAMLQRYKWKRVLGGKKNPLTPARIKALQSINFEVRVKAREKSFWDWFEELKEYKEKYGTAHVPAKDKDKELAIWAPHTRHTFSLMKQGGAKKRNVTVPKEEEFKTLSEIGFKFEVYPRKDCWTYFSKLRAYAEEHGTCHVSKDPHDQDKAYKDVYDFVAGNRAPWHQKRGERK